MGSTSAASSSGWRRRGWARGTSATATSAATRPGSRRPARRRPRSPASWRRSAASTASWSAPSGPAQNPAELVSSPKRAEKLPKVLSDRADALAAGADPGPHAAGAARPGDAGAGLLLRPALRGDRQPRPRLHRLRDRAAAGARQGRQGAAPAGRRAGPAGAASATWSAAGGRSPPIRASRRCSSPRAAAASPTPTSPAGSASGPARRPSPPASRPIHFDIPLQPTSWRAAPICVRSRSCSATPRSRPPRSTPGSTPPDCVTPTLQATPAHDPISPQTNVESR